MMRFDVAITRSITELNKRIYGQPAAPVQETIATPDPLTDLVIVKEASRWTSEYKLMMEWRVKVRNISRTTAYKDIHFKTHYYGDSGTEIDQSILEHTEYIIIQPGQTKKPPWRWKGDRRA
jgi:hypothetical protein